MAATIMVVEDEPAIGALVQTYLRREGFHALWVRSGEQALAELPRHPIALVVLDLGLPGIDGFAVCRQISDRVPVILLTARDEEADRVAGLAPPAITRLPVDDAALWALGPPTQTVELSAGLDDQRRLVDIAARLGRTGQVSADDLLIEQIIVGAPRAASQTQKGGQVLTLGPRPSPPPGGWPTMAAEERPDSSFRFSPSSILALLPDGRGADRTRVRKRKVGWCG